MDMVPGNIDVRHLDPPIILVAAVKPACGAPNLTARHPQFHPRGVAARRCNIVEMSWNYLCAESLITGGESVQRQS
jgi:hypothetical protein